MRSRSAVWMVAALEPTFSWRPLYLWLVALVFTGLKRRCKLLHASRFFGFGRHMPEERCDPLRCGLFAA